MFTFRNQIAIIQTERLCVLCKLQTSFSSSRFLYPLSFFGSIYCMVSARNFQKRRKEDKVKPDVQGSEIIKHVFSPPPPVILNIRHPAYIHMLTDYAIAQ